MVLGRNDKRKRKEGDLVDLMDPLSESPKRTKVHAQRKFAQGAATVFSPAPTMVKEKEKTKPPVITELITHKRPNTEDFLTFLCFRGTSILPPSLNFFNVGSKKDKAEGKASSAPKTNSGSSSSSASMPSTAISKPDSGSTSQSKVAAKSVIAVKKKKKAIPAPVGQKSLNKYKTATSTVQALKKKYQEQRLAKQRIRNKFKASCVMRTRSSTERVVLKTVTKLAPRKFLGRNETNKRRRRGLRSGGLTEKAKKSNISRTKARPISSKPKKKLVVEDQTSESSGSESASSDDDDSAAPAKNPQQPGRSAKPAQKKILSGKSETRRITRSQRESVGGASGPTASRRPSRKTKEAAAVYMEILGRKLVSPDFENDDDDLSVDSFPELPNARRTAQAENEIRAKSKGAKSKDSRNAPDSKDSKSAPSKTRTKPEKPILKTGKRTLRVRRYCELDSEDESETSGEPDKTRYATRRGAGGKIEEPSIRSLRSSSRNKPAKRLISTPLKAPKEKIAKRPRSTPAKKAESEDSEEEEPLGNLLSKLKKKKQEETLEIRKSGNPAERTTKEAPIGRAARKNHPATSQVSDDEESFRGFTKKAISRVLSSCNTHVNANLLATEEAYEKIEERGTQQVKTNLDPKVEPVMSVAPALTMVRPIQDRDTMTTRAAAIETPSANADEDDATLTKCNHVAESPTMNIIDMPLTGIHGRKARVNMSTEQIEKWLNESSMARAKQRKQGVEETESCSSTFLFQVPEKAMKSDQSHLSIPTRIQHLVRPVNVTIAKLAEKARDRMGLQGRIAPSFVTGARIPLARPLNVPIPNRNKINADMKEIIKGRTAKPTKEALSTGDGESSDAVSKSDLNSVDGSPDKKSTPEKKAIFHQRKTFLPKVKERKTATPSANAFSPENESSVYAFESDTEVPINTPFRRKLKELGQKGGSPSEPDTSRTTNEHYSSKLSDLGTSSETDGKCSPPDKFAMPKSFGNLANVRVLPLGKMPTEWGGANCSASIAVQVNFDEQSQELRQQQQQQQQQQQLQHHQEENPMSAESEELQQKCTEISTQTENTNDNEDEPDGDDAQEEEEDDDDGHVFYIPLQTVTRNGPNLVQGQQLIQGVAVKLGTEGPNGPNQRVLLRAQLVTKPPSAVARCPPVGTVQPTTRTPPSCSSSSTSVLDHPYAVVDPSVDSTSATPTAAITPGFQAPLSQPPPAGRASTNPTTRQSTSVANAAPEKTTKSPKSTRERKASVDSTKTGKRVSAKARAKAAEILAASNCTAFPGPMDSNAEARLVEAPTFHPTEKDFQDPLEYIDKIRPIAEKFGICRVVPPANFKPECKVSDDMRFTAYNQYVHRMLHRWGPNVKEMMAIKKYLATQSITLTHPPWIGGMEVDLPHLYQTVQSLGGLKEVIEKKKWQKVADGMKIPKSAQDRVTKLDDIYCKYLLPYDTLSPEEREKLFDDVEEEWKIRETKTLQRLDGQSNDNDDDEDDDDDSSDEIEECIVKGRNMPLNAFYRIARNTQRMWFGENQRSASETEGASAGEVETAFWKHVAERKRHVCVHAASIDSSGRGFGFSVAKNSPFARHPWNLKVLTNNAGSVLRALGPLMGVTVPTLHVGMLFSACCWYRDPHGLPWIEYLHTGAKKIWYGIPDEHNNNFREALSKMVPRYCKEKTIWLPSDTAMVPPEMLVNNGVPLCQTVQEPGQFIVVFPKAFTSSICTGYVVSESVYFAQPAWLENAEQVFKDLHDSCEPSIFSFERLLFSIINDSRSHIDVLKQIMPAVLQIRERELEYRKQLEYIGLANKEKLPLPDTGKGKKGKKVKEDDADFECETCRANLFVSLVNNSNNDSVYCLPHALQLIVRKRQVLKNCTLMYAYTEDELDDLIHKLEDRIEAKSKKANQTRQSK